jgi:hypothetical protein
MFSKNWLSWQEFGRSWKYPVLSWEDEKYTFSAEPEVGTFYDDITGSLYSAYHLVMYLYSSLGRLSILVGRLSS